MEVKDAAYEINITLDEIARNLFFNCEKPISSGSSIVYLIKKDVVKDALDSIQFLCNICTTTSNPEFNKLAHKLLATVGTLLFYYYNRKDPYMDRYTYLYKFYLDIKSLENVATFFYHKFVLDIDCYLVMIETDLKDSLVFPMKESGRNNPKDTFAWMPICIFNRGDLLKIKRDTDDQYQCFNYSPSQLISTVKFSILDNKISGTVDNSKWTDSAWNL